MPMFEMPSSGAPTPPAPPNLPTPPSSQSMPPGGGQIPPPSGPPAAPSQPQVYTMPEKFRAAGGSQPSGGSNRKLVIILVIVLAVAGLGVAGLYVFRNVFTSETNTNTVAVVSNDNDNENLNVTLNLNENSNASTNGNGNVNGLGNVNDNTNTALNTNSSTNSNLNSNTNSSIPIPSSADTDSDGLTDTEEAVYGTDANKPDSDGDGFIDGKQLRTDGAYNGEAYNGYNPAGDGRLEQSTFIKRQNNSTNEYSVIMPSAWTAVLDQSGGVLINPSQATTEFFQVRIYENSGSLPPKDWYKSISPETDVSTLRTTSVNGLEGVYSEDGSTVYLFRGTKVYGVTYNTGSAAQANYYTTFDIIVRNFRLVSSSS